MKKIPRWLFISLALLAALPVAGAAVLKAMFPPERLRELVVPRLESRVGRDVSLGSVKLKVFPYVAIRLQDLAIANSPDFSDSPTVQLDALDLRLEIWPLLKKEFQLSQVRLIGPILRYEVLSDGTNNFVGILAPDTSAAATGGAEQSGSSSASRFEVEDLIVANGGVLYRNHETGRAMRAQFEGKLNLIPGQRAGGTMASDGEVDITKGLTVATGSDTAHLPEVRIEFRALFDPSDGRLAIPELRVRGAGLTLEGSGASQMEDEVRSVRLDLASSEFRIANLVEQLSVSEDSSEYTVGGRATLAIRWAGVFGGPDGETPSLTGTASYTGLTVSSPERGRLVSGASGDVSFTPESVEGHLTGETDLSQLQDPREGEPLFDRGMAAFELGFRGPVGHTELWDISGPVRLTNVSYTSPRLPAPAEIANATVRLSDGGIRADGMLIRVGDSDVSASFSSPRFVRYLLSDPVDRGVAPPIRFTARSDRLVAADFRREEPAIGYSDLVKARLTGRQVDGQDPEEIARARYRLPELSDYRASGTMSIAEWVNPPTNAENLSFQVDILDGVIDITQVQGGVYGGRLSGGLRLDMNGSQAAHGVEYDLNLTTARAGALLERWTTFGERLTGTVNFDIAGSSPLDDGFLPMPAGFTAIGSASFVEGRFEDLGITDAVKEQFNLAPDKLTQFKALGGPFEIRDGQFVVQNWSFGAGDITGVISGAAGLGGVLDLDLAAMLPIEAVRSAGIVQNSPALGALLDQLSSGSGYVPVQLDVGGTMESPALRIDADALAAALGDQAQSQGIDQLQDVGRNLLDQLVAPAGEEPEEEPVP